jgi:HSP20 family protein
MPARVFLPSADIYETPDTLTVIGTGVEKSNVDVRVQDDVLRS